ncbi:hypothetical protein ACFE04_001335 [Oxalis oulophora]
MSWACNNDLRETHSNFLETALNMIDPILQSGFSSEMLRCIHIGLLCVQENAADRPSMASVVVMLSSESVSLALPLKPAYFLDTTMINNEEAVLFGFGLARISEDPSVGTQLLKYHKIKLDKISSFSLAGNDHDRS